MKSPVCHLNLLMASERVTSSPVRFRVMLPVLAALACLGMAVWWAILGGQLMLAQAKVGQLKGEMAARDAAHRDVLSQMARVRELEAARAQLDCYRASIRRRGGLLTALAEAMPLKVQLVKLEIPAPAPPPVFLPPAVAAALKTSPKKPDLSLYGPTGYVERASLVLTGRATKDAPIVALMDSLASEAFTNDVVIAASPANAAEQSPKIRSFRQDAARTPGGARLMAFEAEYRLTGRRFDR